MWLTLNWIIQVDNRILDFITEHLHTPFGDAVMPAITSLGNLGIFWILLAVVLLFLPKWRKAGFQMLAGMALAVLVGSLILKPLIARERPFSANEYLNLLITAPKDFSFPSGHTSSSFAAATVLFRRNKGAGAAAAVLAALIAFSRMYLYVHYPSDILAGLLLGIASGAVGTLLVNAVWRKWKRRPAKQ